MTRERVWPLIEGLLLAVLAGSVLVLAGEAVRASYHGYLHASVGEAVLRDGLQPENPYHAGSPLRYYTLYPLLGALLGRIGGIGPLWAFAGLNMFAALLLPIALDALGRRLGLEFRARRAAFWAMLLGFNGLGWLGYLFTQGDPFGSAPVYALMPMTLAREGFGWDARLQAFLPKFLNVSSYALALPFLLLALAATRARLAWLPLGLALALNPIVGAVAGVLIAARELLHWNRTTWAQRGAWLATGVAGAAAALPFLLPSFVSPPSGPSLTGKPDLGGSPLANLLLPQLLLWVPAWQGLRSFGILERRLWCVGIGLLSGLVLVGEMPQGNEYKLARLLSVLLALPAGIWLAQRGRSWWIFGVLLTLPTLAISVHAYLSYGRQSPPLVLEVQAGRLVPAAWAEQQLSRDARLFEAAADPRAVLVVPPQLFRGAQSRALVQGSLVAPFAHHALYADLPQIHNEGQEDLAARLDELRDLYLGSEAQSEVALRAMRARFPDRPLLILCVPDSREQVLAGSGAREEHWGAWFVPAFSESR
jgi:hypothetical protein